jgi:hypothetical protein
MAKAHGNPISLVDNAMDAAAPRKLNGAAQGSGGAQRRAGCGSSRGDGSHNIGIIAGVIVEACGAKRGIAGIEGHKRAGGSIDGYAFDAAKRAFSRKVIEAIFHSGPPGGRDSLVVCRLIRKYRCGDRATLAINGNSAHP